MNILVFYPYWAYPETVIEFLSKIARRGHKIVAIYADNNPRKLTMYNLNENITIYGAQYLDLSVSEVIVSKYPYFLNLEYIIHNIKIDIIVIQLPLFLTTIQGLRIAEKIKVPTLLEVHGVYAQRGRILDVAQKIYLYTAGYWEFKKATIIRCLTKEDAKEIICYGASPHKIRIVPNPIDVELFKPSLNRTDNILIWTGRMVPEKGLLYLIKALDIIVHRYKHKDIRLLLIGKGPQKPLIMKLVKKFSIQDNVFLLGPLPRKRIAEYLSKASIFVFPSVKEGMPLSLLEALSSGLPAIGIATSGVKNLIIHGYNGLLVPTRDPKMIAEAILFLLNDKNLRLKMSKNAREYVVHNFSYQKILPDLERLYAETIESYYKRERN